MCLFCVCVCVLWQRHTIKVYCCKSVVSGDLSAILLNEVFNITHDGSYVQCRIMQDSSNGLFVGYILLFTWGVVRIITKLLNITHHLRLFLSKFSGISSPFSMFSLKIEAYRASETWLARFFFWGKGGYWDGGHHPEFHSQLWLCSIVRMFGSCIETLRTLIIM